MPAQPTQKQADRLQDLLVKLVTERGETYNRKTSFVHLSRQFDSYGRPQEGSDPAYFLFDAGPDYEQEIWLGTSYEEAATELRRQVAESPLPVAKAA
jgi:hypothetical protein